MSTKLTGTGCLVLVVLTVVLSMIPGFALMLLCGALYSEFGWLRPIGFFPAWGISVALGAVFGRFRASSSK